LDVQALSRAEGDEPITVAVGGQVDGTTQRDLWEITRGNPMFLRKVVSGGLRSGALRCIERVWRWGTDQRRTKVGGVDGVAARTG
jgi:hypothetical protein